MSKGETISVREKSQAPRFDRGGEAVADNFQTPWLEVNREAFSALVAELPDENAVLFPLRVQLVVEYYSQRL